MDKHKFSPTDEYKVFSNQIFVHTAQLLGVQVYIESLIAP